jgi:hypothetical protein
MAKPPADTNVNVPITISIGPGVDGERLREIIADTAGTQLGRALNVLDERGEWEANLAHFDIQFKGNAASLPDDRKRELYGYVGDGVAKGAEVAQTRRVGRPRKRPSRQKKAKSDVKAGKRRTRTVNTWHEFAAPPNEEFENALLVALAERFHPRIVPATYGVLFRLKGKPGVQLWIASNQRWMSWRLLGDVVWSGATPGSEPFSFDPEASDFRLEQVPLLEGITQWRERQYKRAATQLASKRVGEVRAQKDIQQPGRELEAAARAAVDAYTQDWPTRIYVFYRLRGTGLSRLIPYVLRSVPVQPRIDVVALVDKQEVEVADQAAEGLTDGKESGRNLVPKQDAGGKDAGQGEGDGDGAGRGAGKALGSDVTAPPGQEVGVGGRGVVIGERYDFRKNAPIFPPGVPHPDAKSAEFLCQPFKDEPHVDKLEAGGAEMKRLIAEIAARLDMAPCDYPANFCLQAARMIRIRTSQVQSRFQSDRDGTFHSQLTVGSLDAAGHFYFRGIDSVAVQYLQHLAGTVPKIRQLMALVRDHTYPRSTFAPHHWFQDVFDEATQACGFIFLCANQIMMQQLLDSSRHAVKQRQNNPEYERVFTVLCKTHLADQVEMVLLRDSLKQFTSMVGDRKGYDAYAHARQHLAVQSAMTAWTQSIVDTRAVTLLVEHGDDATLVTKLADATDYVFRRGLTSEPVARDAGAIVESDRGWVIRASDGELYSADELDTMIDIRQKTVLSIDPLINQLLARLVSEIRPLVDHPERIPQFLENLFNAMLTKNDEVCAKNRANFEYAFEHAQIHKVDGSTPPAVELVETQIWGFWLTGIHGLAHRHVGVRFEGDAFYLAAAHKLISQEYSWRTFVEDMIFIGSIVLTIICPPLGAAVGFIGNLAMGLERHAHAKEQETIYQSLIKPEEVLNYAQIQVDLFLAKLQIGLSFLEVIPLAGKGAKALGGLGKRTVTSGAKRGVRQLAKDAVISELDRLAQVSAEHFLVALTRELAEEAIEDKIVDMLVTPIIQAHIEQLQKEIAEGRL